MRVEDTKKNMQICSKYCGTCPTYKDIKGEIFFCVRGRSSAEDIEKAGCKCPECAVQKNYGCTGTYYCIYGSCE